MYRLIPSRDLKDTRPILFPCTSLVWPLQKLEIPKDALQMITTLLSSGPHCCCYAVLCTVWMPHSLIRPWRQDMEDKNLENAFCFTLHSHETNAMFNGRWLYARGFGNTPKAGCGQSADIPCIHLTNQMQPWWAWILWSTNSTPEKTVLPHTRWPEGCRVWSDPRAEKGWLHVIYMYRRVQPLVLNDPGASTI